VAARHGANAAAEGIPAIAGKLAIFRASATAKDEIKQLKRFLKMLLKV
jgi:hypothetical protein